MSKRIGLAVVASVGLAILPACSSAQVEAASQDKLLAASVEAIQGLDPAKAVISEVAKTPAKISWRVTSGAVTYACDADGFYRLPWCRPDA